jgi:hypothetical protein
MPLVFERDDERRRITVTLTGPVLLAELNANLERLAADGVWDYAVLYDGRMATTALSVDETRRLVQVVRELTARHGARGPVALVMATEAARMYSMLAEGAGLTSEVFHDFVAAEAWLVSFS